MIPFTPSCFITARAADVIVRLLFSSRYLEASSSLVVLGPSILFSAQMQC